MPGQPARKTPMPSPAAHSILGLAAGCLFLPRGRSAPRIFAALWRYRGWLLLALVAGHAPDFDYLPGLIAGELNRWHHGYSHSLGWCLLLTAMAGCFARALRPSAVKRVMLVVLCSSLVHLVADLLTTDVTPPLGIMIAWPVWDAYISSKLDLFPPMQKNTLGDILQPANLRPLLHECLITLPILVGALWTWRQKSEHHAA